MPPSSPSSSRSPGSRPRRPPAPEDVAASRLLLRAIERLHREDPLAAGFRADEIVAAALAAGRVRRAGSHRGGNPVTLGEVDLHALLDRLAAGGGIERRGRRLARAGHEPQLGPTMRARADDLLDRLRASGASPPPVPPLARERGLPEAVLAFLRSSGELVRVRAGVEYPSDVLDALRRTAVELIRDEGALTLGRFRQVTGASRRHAVTLLEHFDREGLMRREGDARVLS